MAVEQSTANELLASIQDLLCGPGGSVAIIKDGETVLSHSYGFADLDRRITLTPQMHMPICSISKHMVCLVLASLEREPTSEMVRPSGSVHDQLSAELKRLLPHLVDNGLIVADLYNMQSGMRDYWAMTTLWGAHPEGEFCIASDAPQALARTKSFHFRPGTEYSYSNANFHILGRLIETVAGQSLGQLLAERVFKPAGMKTAALCPNTFGHPLPVVGYEGDDKHGYTAAVNRIEWAGDAGIVASLDDMIAYEKWLERTYAEEGSLYRTIAQPQSYRDGNSAKYGFGLAHGETAGQAWLGHGGALRGFRLFRAHVPESHLSVVVLFNHEADSFTPAEAVIKRFSGWQESGTAQFTPSAGFAGDYLDDDAQLLVRIENADAGQISIKYHMAADKAKLTSETHAESESVRAVIDGDVLHLTRKRDNRGIRANRIKTDRATTESIKGSEYTGIYRNDDADSTFHCCGPGSKLYGSFDGFLGKGPAYIMRYVGEDVWTLSNPRGMDAPAPGDWTVVFKRSKNGTVSGVTIGCWLARKNEFTRTS